ncbi:hypothetical protein Y032_0286g1382 [Ancylostoma ceylanicum]|uniref:non-specific serine/threonine protein kinase n=1 Tax=Ancylostoma ceylanicum TaxID=53326 RepID=A0A016S5X1_9BILA|nr:hypothetical protein Y032_0286g1382 [Ancylostoma ceylanicum]
MQRQMLIKLVCAAKSTMPPPDLPTASSAPLFRKDLEGIAHELVTAELIDCHDLVIVAANLQKLIDLAEQKSDKRSVTFALNSGVAPNEIPDERTLTGFAQISLID